MKFSMPDTCNKFDASEIDGSTYTHLVYSFASISADRLLEPWVGSPDEVDKYKEFNKIKESNPDLKTVIAVTEGVFYGAGMNPATFREVSEKEETRIAFADSVVSFLQLVSINKFLIATCFFSMSHTLPSCVINRYTVRVRRNRR